MGFPIVIGAKSVSSRLVASPEPLEEFASDGHTTLFPVLSASAPILITATTETLQAVVTLSYYDMIREDDGVMENCTAELRVQISPAAESCSSAYRDSLHRIPLPRTAGGSVAAAQTAEQSSCLLHEQSSPIEPQLLISADQRFLTCLVPHPFSSYSSVIVFQLRRPVSTNQQQQAKSKVLHPPLPSYIQRPMDHTVVAVIATNPRVLARPDNEPLLDATCLCDVTTMTNINNETTTSTNNGPSILLVGSHDGCIRAASYRPLGLGEVVHEFYDDDEDDDTVVVHPAAMQHLTEWNDNGTVGRLAVVLNDGNVSVFRSHVTKEFVVENGGVGELSNHSTQFVHQNGDGGPQPISNGRSGGAIAAPSSRQSTISSKTTGTLLISLTETHRIPEVVVDDDSEEESIVFLGAEWVAGSYLALAQRPSATGGTTVHVYGLYDQGRSAAVSILNMTLDRLQENLQSTFRYDPVVPAHRIDVRASRSTLRRDAPRSLVYDPASDSIAVSDFLTITTTGAGSETVTTAQIPFICLWSWRTNAQGYTAMASLQESDGEDVDLPFFCVSRLFFTRDHEYRRGIAHLLASTTNGFAPRRLRKEMYETALLSPPHESSRQRSPMYQPSTLLLSSTSVSYPTTSKASPSGENFELRWSESFIPHNYVATYGAPRVAAIGTSNNKSIAVASSRGFCILDNCSSADKLSSDAKWAAVYKNVNRNAKGDRDAAVAKMLRRGHSHPRWSLFGNEADERRFRVISMAWWEGSGPDTTNSISSDDILVTVIEVLDGKEGRAFFLPCWPSSYIDVKSQLLCPFGAMQLRSAKEFKWGALLPTGFIPATLDFICLPNAPGSQLQERKACILLADASYTTSYLVYQLQVVGSGSSDAFEPKHLEVVSRCGSAGAIGSPAASLFLASASAAFDLTGKGHHDTSDSYVATIGVLRRYGAGLDAISVSRSGVVAVGQVMNSADSNVDDPLHELLDGGHRPRRGSLTG